MRGRLVAVIIAMSLMWAGSSTTLANNPANKPANADAVFDLTTTYSIYAKSIWHDASATGDVGGYWGDGIAVNNGNGNVRGMVNTMLGYAMLVHAMDQGWLAKPQADELSRAGLSREDLLRYIRLNLVHLIAHHVSTSDAHKPAWGFSWQSTLWMGGAGPAVVLVWKDLPEDLKTNFKRVAGAEADRIVAKPPKDYLPGDTGAEENAWDTAGPGVALAVDPTNPHATAWMTALKSYAVNVYSIKADQSSDAMIGNDKSRDIVHTKNLFDDFTLENHGFFHPDYVQVSAQYVSEALLFLQMGDRLNGTKLAETYRPYAMHHLADVWANVLRPLVLPDGEQTFPNGTDWTINCSMTPSYLACIGTLLRDPIAADAEKHQIVQAQRRRAISPAGRILGDTNLEWWWEPLLIKRWSTDLLQHEYRDSENQNMVTKVTTPRHASDESHYWFVAKTWMFRNQNYFVSASWGARHMATFTPFFSTDESAATYLTTPIVGILPENVESLVAQKITPDARTLLLQCHDGSGVAIVCLPHSVLWISPSGFRPLAIENDKLSGGRRDLFDAGGVHTLPALSGKSVTLNDWANIDSRLGMMDRSGLFKYTGTSTFNRKSVACDQIGPDSGDDVWWMVPGVNREQMTRQATEFKVSGQNDCIQIDLHDGPSGARYRIKAQLTADQPASVTVDRR